MNRIFLALVVLYALPSFAGIINIDKGGSGDHTTIQAGIDAANEGDEIVVSPGVYTENIVIQKSITLRSATPDNPVKVLDTVIDGSGSGSVISCNSSQRKNIVIRGFLVKNGNAQNGGGIYNSNSTITVADSTLSENTAKYGGGIYNTGTLNVRNCMFTENGRLEKVDGGGIYSSGRGSYLTIINTTFNANSAGTGMGGGISVRDSYVTIKGCNFNRNTATGGGGIFELYAGSLNITDCTFNGNEAVACSGGIYKTSPGGTITNCAFNWNKATYHGGVSHLESGTVFNNCTFTGNAPDVFYNGALYYRFVTLIECSFCLNPIDPDAASSSSRDNNFNYCAPPKGIVEGDLTGDGRVDIADLAVLAENWLTGANNDTDMAKTPQARISPNEPEPLSGNVCEYLTNISLVEAASEDTGCGCKGDVTDSTALGEPDGKVDGGDLNVLIHVLMQAGAPYIVDPVPAGMECMDLTDSTGIGDPDGRLDPGDLSPLLGYLYSLGPTTGYSGPCMNR